MTAIAGFLTSLPPTAKALSALGGAVVFGVAMTLATVRVQGLPAQVEQNTAAIVANTRAIRELARGDSLILARQDQIVCLLMLPDTVPPMQANRACP